MLGIPKFAWVLYALGWTVSFVTGVEALDLPATYAALSALLGVPLAHVLAHDVMKWW